MSQLKLRWENYQHFDHFGNQIGYKVTKIDEKNFEAEVSLKISPKHLSPAGRVHGGVISTLFDLACGAAVFSTLGLKDFCSTVELKVNYFHPLKVGDDLKVKTKVVFRGKRLCVAHGFCYRKGRKDPVAMATGTFNVVKAEN